MFVFVLCCVCLQPLLSNEGNLKSEILERAKDGMLRDRKWVCKRAKQLFREWKRSELAKEGLTPAQKAQVKNIVFKASDGWYYRFLERSRLAPRKITSKKKMTLAEFKRKNKVWLPRARRHLLEKWPGLVDENGRFKLDRLANVDEVPMQLINRFNKQVDFVFLYLFFFFFLVFLFSCFLYLCFCLCLCLCPTQSLTHTCNMHAHATHTHNRSMTKTTHRQCTSLIAKSRRVQMTKDYTHLFY